MKMKSLLIMPLLLLAHFSLFSQVVQVYDLHPNGGNNQYVARTFAVYPTVSYTQATVKNPVIYHVPVTGIVEPVYVVQRPVVERVRVPVVYLAPVIENNCYQVVLLPQDTPEVCKIEESNKYVVSNRVLSPAREPSTPVYWNE